MSTEWTIVSKNKCVVKQQVSIVERNPHVRPSFEEKCQREIERREKWEQKRQHKIDEYNAEFPLLPGSKDLVTDSQKIAYIDAKIAAKKESNHKAYLEREAKRQEKAERAARIAKLNADNVEKAKQRAEYDEWLRQRDIELAEKYRLEQAKKDAEIAEKKRLKQAKKDAEEYKRKYEEAARKIELEKIAEKEHVQNMIEKWGAHRWYRMVAYTDEDCWAARDLRAEEEDRERYLDYLEEQREKEEERLEKIREAEEEKYIAEQTANMSKIEKEMWIDDFRLQRMRDLEDEVYSYWDSIYWNSRQQEKIDREQEREDKERLDAWNAKHKK